MTNLSGCCSGSLDLIGSIRCLSEQRMSCLAIQKASEIASSRNRACRCTVRRRANFQQPPGLRRMHGKSCYLVGTAVIVCGRPPRLRRWNVESVDNVCGRPDVFVCGPHVSGTASGGRGQQLSPAILSGITLIINTGIVVQIN